MHHRLLDACKTVRVTLDQTGRWLAEAKAARGRIEYELKRATLEARGAAHELETSQVRLRRSAQRAEKAQVQTTRSRLSGTTFAPGGSGGGASALVAISLACAGSGAPDAPPVEQPTATPPPIDPELSDAMDRATTPEVQLGGGHCAPEEATWFSCAMKGGKVASVGGRLLDGAAKVIIGQFFAALARKAGGGTTAEGGLADLWVMWLGPLIGAALAAALQKPFLRAKASPKVESDDAA